VTVEEVPDEGDSDIPSNPWVEDFPQPVGTTYGEDATYFEHFRRMKEAKGEHPWMPFESEEEWELARWLMTSGLSKKAIDDYLKLKIVSADQR
ncbi:hypothetical protein C8Q76DRAFT_566105, partial [Earliella scabrosa]